jgi:membrane-associated protease RseP (regulator of RpoE activity)
MERHSRTSVWIIVAALAGLLLGCLLGVLFGGLISWSLGRAAAPPAFDPAPRVPLVPAPPAVPETPPIRGGGVLITQVAANSPAEAAGIQVGDIVTALDDISLAENRLPEVVTRYAPGDVVTLTILRGGRQIDVRIRLGRHPEQPELPWIGIFYQELPGGSIERPTP